MKNTTKLTIVLENPEMTSYPKQPEPIRDTLSSYIETLTPEQIVLLKEYAAEQDAVFC